jgi:site-specific recombinase XerD
MMEDMQLRGLSPKTQECYVGAVKSLAKHYRRTPDRLTEEEIRQYFLYLANEKQVAEGTFQVQLYGVRFLYERTLQREWPALRLIRPKKRKKLPVVLSREEVGAVLGRVRSQAARMALTMIYSCGLRVSEGAHLQTKDVDSGRMLLCVRNGKGGKDRCVPLPQRSLELLRAYWIVSRPRRWLFPGRKGRSFLSPSVLQKTFKAAVRESPMTKNASVHTLRHSYATHLLEAGVDLRTIQQLLGHRSPKTTAVYTHLTQKTVEVVHGALDRLMADL